MKKILSVSVFVSLLFFNVSCYKTGEIIYQTVCKPVSVSLNTDLYGIELPSFNADITYGFSNKRPLTITRKDFNNTALEYFVFTYDGGNNLVKISKYDYTNQQVPLFYLMYTYPPGTTGSIADVIQVSKYVLNQDGTTYSISTTDNMYFNTEFQLTRITRNNRLIGTYEYDYGGNLIKNIVYSYRYNQAVVNDEVWFYYEFKNYDNKINMFRSDRYLQLFMNVYSKNNPTSSSVVYPAGPEGLPYVRNSFGGYTYNSRGYWESCAPGGYFAIYDCLP